MWAPLIRQICWTTFLLHLAGYLERIQVFLFLGVAVRHGGSKRMLLMLAKVLLMLAKVLLMLAMVLVMAVVVRGEAG